MNPLEAALRAACREMGADPDCKSTGGWRNFLAVGRPIVAAFIDALPTELAAPVRQIVEQEITP